MKDWKKIIDSITPDSYIWEERPVDFITFVSDPYFLYKDPELSPLQLQEALNIVGEKPEDFFKKDRTNHLYVWLWGKGCLASFVKITDIITGKTQTVEDWALSGERFTLLSWDSERNALVPMRCQTPYSKGISDVYRVITKGGRNVVVSPEHKFYARDGWKELKDLKVGSEILIHSKLSDRDIELVSEFKTVKGNLYFAPIEDIIHEGKAEIFDFEVPIYHNYSLYGIINHNSGKGTLASIIYLYALYILACMKSPQEYFGTASSDEISLVNVATNYRQAKDVVFSRLENRFSKVRWFKDRFKIIKSGKQIAGNPDSTRIIELRPGSGEIVFSSNNIVAKCLHAQNESWEGKNLIFWVMDEASGFKSEKKLNNASEIYATLQTSTRELPWIGIITSFPRLSKDFDFTYQIYKDIVEGRINGYASLRTPWEMRPNNFSGETFDFVVDRDGTTIKIPVEYKDYFLKDPEDAKKRYLCIPPSTSEEAFFEYLEDANYYIEDREPVIKTLDRIVCYEGKNYLEKIITQYVKINFPIYVSIDAGEKYSDAAMSIGHIENNKLIYDAIIIWRPQEKLPVNINNLIEFVIQLSKFYKINRVRIDHWNAAALEQQLRANGIQVIAKNVGLEDYNLFKNLLYTGFITFPSQSEVGELFYQLKALKNTNTKPRVILGKQDIADSVAGLAGIISQVLGKPELPRAVVVSRPSPTVSNIPLIGAPSLAELFNMGKRKLPSPRRVK